MKVNLTSTAKIVTLITKGVIQARIWEGSTQSGIPIHCYIIRVAKPNDGKGDAEFERELMTVAPPSTEVEAIPLRQIL